MTDTAEVSRAAQERSSQHTKRVCDLLVAAAVGEITVSKSSEDSRVFTIYYQKRGGDTLAHLSMSAGSTVADAVEEIKGRTLESLWEIHGRMN